MISIIIAIGVFRYYQKLAVRNGKVHWKYGFLGMGICLGVQLLFWLIYKSIEMLLNFQEPDFLSATLVMTLGWIASIFTVWFVHKHLEKKFNKEMQYKEIDKLGKKRL